MSSLNLALIGNGSFGALLDGRGRIVWACLPRFDGDPVFCSLLRDHGEPDAGYYDVELMDCVRSEQSYRPNSAILITNLYGEDGSEVEITDFAPRFKQFDRTFRPTMLIRHVRPRAGNPRLRIRLRPSFGYGAHRPEITRGSNHIRYVLPESALRLTTDAAVSYILDETAFNLERPVTMLLGPDESLVLPVAATARDFYEKTHDYWLEWVRYLALPFEWQEAVIRAAITLKLCHFEESGAIVAAMTTSIPEAANSGRNWDYRYCWLRDSYFVVHALNRLGATRTMEGYLSYINNIVATVTDGSLQPAFGISQEHRLEEKEIATLEGYRGMGPVRVGNHAYKQTQNDGYGSVVLAAAQSFFDARLRRPGTVDQFRRLESLGEKAVALWDQPDAGMWELRTRKAVHTFSSIMCWAACDRLARIANRLGLSNRSGYWNEHAERIRAGVLEQAWNKKLKSFVGSFGGDEVDASLLLMPELGFLPPDDKRFHGTISLVERRLRRGMHIFRYGDEDDFGFPENAFNICTFWYIDALAMVGRQEEARELFENMLSCRNPVGLLSEDLDPATHELWGNFPQTYSMVGLINSAMRLSKPWEEAF
jgi:GH15 family glucan-1,4-alpha-glucosidase